MASLDIPAELRVTVAELGERTRVASIAGELDLHNSDTLRERLWPLGDDPRGDVIVDLSDVSFLDSTAIGVLTGLAKKLRERAHALVVVSPDPRLRRIFEITGLLSILHVEPSLAEAMDRWR